MRKSVIVLVSIVACACIASCASSSGSHDAGAKDVMEPMDGTMGSDSNEMDVESRDVKEHPDAAACAAESPGMCAGCCEKAFPVGHDQLVTAELDCACVGPKLCGGLESGVMIDSGKLATGACGAYCGATKKTRVDDDCKQCLREARGTVAKPGHCYTAVEGKCTSAPCKDYEACVAACGADAG